jgi:hypothetical protein
MIGAVCLLLSVTVALPIPFGNMPPWHRRRHVATRWRSCRWIDDRRRPCCRWFIDRDRAGHLIYFGDLASLSEAKAFATWLAPFRKSEWLVIVPEARLRQDSKPPLGGPEAALAYLSRNTHRVAISNARMVSANAATVAFRWKDYRIKSGNRQKVMRLATPKLIRRFLIHVLPDGFHRIRHYVLLASPTRKANIRTIRALNCDQRPKQAAASGPKADIIPLTLREPCPCCGSPMRTFSIARSKTPATSSLRGLSTCAASSWPPLSCRGPH